MRIKPDFRRAKTWMRVQLNRLWQAITRRTWMKLLSLLLAILLWNYVVTTNTSITRSKVITGVSGYVTGQSTLTTYGLALLSDPSAQLNNLTVELEVAQSMYSQTSVENVQVMADLSSVRTAGIQEVPLKATTSYGRVISILPESVTLTFETLDSRLIPVNVETTGDVDAKRWYNISRTNPTAITVSGAASVVRSIAEARVYTDVTGADRAYVRAEPYVLLDGEGNEIDQTSLTRSASSITVTAEVYPTKELPVSTEIENVVTGRVAEGYRISEISIQPETITVAAEQSLLDGISELWLEPVSVEGLSQSFSARAKVSKLSDFKSMSNEQVYVNVTIVEEEESMWIDNTVITFVSKDEGLQLEWQPAALQVYVTGPTSVVEELKEEGIPITVNLTDLQAGSHECELLFPTDKYPDVRFVPEATTITVTLTQLTEE